MIRNKNTFKFIAILLLLTGSFYSCNNDGLKDGEYRAVCARIIVPRFGSCPAGLIIESDKPIANTSPIDGYVHFFVDELPSGFASTWATVVFRLTGETAQCLSVEAPVIEIISIEKCEDNDVEEERPSVRILGKWQLIEARTDMLQQITDYSQHNIVFEFKEGNILLVTGLPDDYRLGLLVYRNGVHQYLISSAYCPLTDTFTHRTLSVNILLSWGWHFGFGSQFRQVCASERMYITVTSSFWGEYYEFIKLN